MVPFDCEYYIISHLLSMNDTKFCIGLLQQEGLLVKGDWVIRISKNNNSAYERFDYNLKTKELKISKKENTKSEFIFVSNLIIDSNCVIDVSNDGMRWEGSCMNHSPFGYGSLYNSSNELIYRGVMIGDKKECFGIELFPDLSQIEYCGCYWNNERHGYGMLYDRKGELMYEGDWWCGSNDFERNQKVILKGIDNDSSGSTSDDDDDIEDYGDSSGSASDDDDAFEDDNDSSGSASDDDDDDIEDDNDSSGSASDDDDDDIEGDWLCSSNEYETNVIMIDIDNDRMVHSSGSGSSDDEYIEDNEISSNDGSARDEYIEEDENSNNSSGSASDDDAFEDDNDSSRSGCSDDDAFEDDSDSSRSGSSDDDDFEDDNDSSRSGSSDDDDFEDDNDSSRSGSSDDDEGFEDEIEDTSVHSLISELVIDEGYGSMFKGDLLLCGFVNLERLVIKKSFQNVTSLIISDNGLLKSIEIEDYSFYETTSLSLNSMMIYD